MIIITSFFSFFFTYFRCNLLSGPVGSAAAVAVVVVVAATAAFVVDVDVAASAAAAVTADGADGAVVDDDSDQGIKQLFKPTSTNNQI